MNLKVIFNKNSQWPHMELELEIFAIVEKLVKYVIHLSNNSY
jgi:hypothetical protein